MISCNTAMSFVKFISLLFVFSVAIFFGYQVKNFTDLIPSKIKEHKNSDTIVLAGKTIKVVVADTPRLRSQGLMYKTYLPENNGMLFVFDFEDYHAFWMKNTKIPLDIIWLNSDKRIVDIEKYVTSCLSDPCPIYVPNKKAKYALELNAGWTEDNNIFIGDYVEFQF